MAQPNSIRENLYTDNSIGKFRINPNKGDESAIATPRSSTYAPQQLSLFSSKDEQLEVVKTKTGFFPYRLAFGGKEIGISLFEEEAWLARSLLNEKIRVLQQKGKSIDFKSEDWRERYTEVLELILPTSSNLPKWLQQKGVKIDV